MKPETTAQLRQILESAKTRHAEVSDAFRTAQAATKGRPAPQGSPVRKLLNSKRKEALRGVLAAVALEGPGATFKGLNLKDCFTQVSKDIQYVHRLRVLDVFPELPPLAAVEVEGDLGTKGIKFKASRAVALVGPAVTR